MIVANPLANEEQAVVRRARAGDLSGLRTRDESGGWATVQVHVPMPPYRVPWLEIAERQYLDLPEGGRRLVDECLAQLERDPLGLSGRGHGPSSGHWSAPVGDGLVLYAVVVELATVIVLRLVAL